MGAGGIATCPPSHPPPTYPPSWPLPKVGSGPDFPFSIQHWIYFYTRVCCDQGRKPEGYRIGVHRLTRRKLQPFQNEAETPSATQK